MSRCFSRIGSTTVALVFMLGNGAPTAAQPRSAAGLMPLRGIGTVSAPEATRTAVTGQMNYRNYIVAKYFLPAPTIGLVCISRSVLGKSEGFVPKSGQILGRLTTPLAPAPFKFEIALPILPSGDYVDISHGKAKQRGVQVYAATAAINLVGDSYLEQLEQGSGYQSVLVDPKTGGIREGALLIYAPDAGQKGPSGVGEDGKLFTADDPVASIRKGYCVMRISPDGKVRYDAKDFRMDLLEPASVATPDFSTQGILESYNSLLALLQE